MQQRLGKYFKQAPAAPTPVARDNLPQAVLHFQYEDYTVGTKTQDAWNIAQKILANITSKSTLTQQRVLMAACERTKRVFRAVRIFCHTAFAGWMFTSMRVSLSNCHPPPLC